MIWKLNNCIIIKIYNNKKLIKLIILKILINNNYNYNKLKKNLIKKKIKKKKIQFNNKNQCNYYNYSKI